MSDPIYLDYAAATPMADEAIGAIQPFLKNRFYNPSAIYQASREVRKSVEQARVKVAGVLGARDQEIVFTAGGTEANNLAISGVMIKYPGANVVVSSIEHESVLEPAAKFERRIAPVDASGVVDLEKLSELIDEKTVFVSIMYANNEIGTIQPIKQISELISQKRSKRTSDARYPLYFHTDACQAANYLDLHVSRLGVDMMTLNGGKIYAMKQSGCLYIKSGTDVSGLILGGGQEDGLRSGTENVAALHSFATMLQIVQDNRKDESQKQQSLRDELFATLSQELKDTQLNGHLKKRLPNNLNIQIPGVDGERLVMELDEAGLMVATGSACTASNDEPSHVLLACGLDDSQASSSIRVTLGRGTTGKDIEKASKIIIETVKQHLELV